MKCRLLVTCLALVLACDDDPESAVDASSDQAGTDVLGDTARDTTLDPSSDATDAEVGSETDDAPAEDGLADPDRTSDLPTEDTSNADTDAPDLEPDLPAEDAADADTAEFDASLGEGECHSESDCDSGGERCLAPGEFIGCGIPREPDPDDLCDEDGDCENDEFCEMSPPEACLEFPQEICQPDCAAEDGCAANEFCAPDGRCVPDPCLQLGSSDGCPSHFVCRAGDGFDEGNPRCLRTICEEQTDCQAGHCVEGFCYDAPGSCIPPVP